MLSSKTSITIQEVSNSLDIPVAVLRSWIDQLDYSIYREGITEMFTAKNINDFRFFKRLTEYNISLQDVKKAFRHKKTVEGYIKKYKDKFEIETIVKGIEGDLSKLNNYKAFMNSLIYGLISDIENKIVERNIKKL